MFFIFLSSFLRPWVNLAKCRHIERSKELVSCSCLQMVASMFPSKFGPIPILGQIPGSFQVNVVGMPYSARGYIK